MAENYGGIPIHLKLYGYMHILLAIFKKGNIFCVFLFASVNETDFYFGILLIERTRYQGSTLFSLIVVQ